MTDKEIEAIAGDDFDCLPTDDDFWSDATVIKPNDRTVSQ